MATSAQILSAIASSSNFQARVRVLGCKAASDIYSEASNTTGHTARIAFANDFMLNSIARTPAVAIAVVATQLAATVADQADIPDGDISNALAAIWNVLAGV